MILNFIKMLLMLPVAITLVTLAYLIIIVALPFTMFDGYEKKSNAAR